MEIANQSIHTAPAALLFVVAALVIPPCQFPVTCLRAPKPNSRPSTSTSANNFASPSHLAHTHTLYAHTMADDSDSSGLSEHSDKEIQKLAPIFVKAKKATKASFPPPKESPPRPKRAPSPPHEDVFADNPDVAVRIEHDWARGIAKIARLLRVRDILTEGC